MPKLSTKAASRVATAEPTYDTGFPLWDEGLYVARLESVKEDQAQNGGLNWNTQFTDAKNVATGEKPSGSQFYRIWLPPKSLKMPADYVTFKMNRDGVKPSDENLEERQAAWDRRLTNLDEKLAAFFAAFGYAADSDTDEFLGEYAVIEVVVETARGGKHKGKPVNAIRNVYPLSHVQYEDADSDDDDDDADGDY